MDVQPGGPLPVRRIARGAHSGLVSPRLQGAIRSRTFTIEKKYILYRARGQDAQVRLIIDGFLQELAERTGEGPLREALSAALDRRLAEILAEH